MNGVNKSSRYLLRSYYVTRAKNAHLVEETALLLRISILHISVSVVNRKFSDIPIGIFHRMESAQGRTGSENVN